MKDRLEQFIRAEGITRAAFADSIGVARAAITHIMSGRNKPGYDFILNTMKAYPVLNVEWLLSGHGSMYKSDDLFSTGPSTEPSPQTSPAPGPDTGGFPSSIPLQSPPERDTILPPRDEVKALLQPKAAHQVKRVIIFYDDGTFEELSAK